MKKRELVLDFTSLLDVILILLFVVIANMNQISVSSAKEYEQSVSLAHEQLQISQNHEKELNIQLEELNEQYRALQNNYEYLKLSAKQDTSSPSDYKTILQSLTKLTLFCQPQWNLSSNQHEVKVDIYCTSDQTEAQSYFSSFAIIHDFTLSRQERIKLHAQQVLELTNLFSSLPLDNSCGVWCSIQYPYEDENFSNSDLTLMKSALTNLERSLSLPCYTEEIQVLERKVSP